MDIPRLIQTAKLGRTRKDAQVDCCAAFAAALYDVLTEHGVECRLVTAVKRSVSMGWAHVVVEAAGVYYDSLGEFSTAIYRHRAKIHHSVSVEISYEPDTREECFESELDEMHAFYLRQLRAAIVAKTPAPAAAVRRQRQACQRACVAQPVSSRRRAITKPDPIDDAYRHVLRFPPEATST